MTEQTKDSSRKKINSLINFRDLGGIKTTDKLQVKFCKILRADSLAAATIDDLQKLKDYYHLQTVVDLRTEVEIQHHPDHLPAGVDYVFNPVVDSLKEFFPKNLQESGDNYFAKLAAAIEHKYVDVNQLLANSYRGYVLDDCSVKSSQTLFKLLLANHDGALLYHCSAGKDRTGFATALILLALGIDKRAIYDDYLLTNGNVISLQDKAVMMAGVEKAYPEAINRQIRTFLGVKKSWLETTFKIIDEQYGSVANYLEKALMLTEKQISDLHAIYLEPIN